MTGKITVTYVDRYQNDEYSNFKVKSGEKLSISNLSKKSYKKDANGNRTTERMYKDNTLYSGETRVTWTGTDAFYSSNGTSSNYVFDSKKYYNDDAYCYDPALYNNNAEKFYDDYYEDNAPKFVDWDKGHQDIHRHNPEAFEVDKQQHDLLLNIVNAANNEDKDILSERDLSTMYAKFRENKNAYKNWGVTNIIHDGEKGIYRVFYKHEQTKINEETGEVKVTGEETRSLTFDYVKQGETQTLEDFEHIGEKLVESENEEINNFAERVKNYRSPLANDGIDWITPIIDFFKNLF